ncbi:hypothetical protein RYR28_002268 [Edwardsiella piscicida]|uniref:hypothetical protein n=2 Tax=Edwardsiella piscicida TaxID=1263550 RepID=UPI002908BDA9|nr:hypothetical protein [Edwardsiella piscicida]
MAKHGYLLLAALWLLSAPLQADTDLHLLPGVKLSVDNPLEEALEPLDDWSENALEPLDDWSEKALEPLDDWPENALRHRKWRGDRDDQGRRPIWHRHHDDDDDDDDD